ncbi:putative cartilage matrix-associated protein [Diretmus argenteus]
MSWTHAALLALLTLLLALSLSPEVNTAAVPDRSAMDPEGPSKRIFMREADASDFFGRRSRRAEMSPDEIAAEQRQVRAADQRKREFHEETFDSDAGEENDEQDDWTGGRAEQWRAVHYEPGRGNNATA